MVPFQYRAGPCNSAILISNEASIRMITDNQRTRRRKSNYTAEKSYQGNLRKAITGLLSRPGFPMSKSGSRKATVYCNTQLDTTRTIVSTLDRITYKTTRDSESECVTYMREREREQSNRKQRKKLREEKKKEKKKDLTRPLLHLCKLRRTQLLHIFTGF